MCFIHMQGELALSNPNPFSQLNSTPEACAYRIKEKFSEQEYRDTFGCDKNKWDQLPSLARQQSLEVKLDVLNHRAKFQPGPIVIIARKFSECAKKALIKVLSFAQSFFDCLSQCMIKISLIPATLSCGLASIQSMLEGEGFSASMQRLSHLYRQAQLARGFTVPAR